ncbi:bifunctional biotin--[acetyl-CoA-carboxylase] ligase/biotin operon repressor BirA [Entomomonas moraniae]|uniref:Bifunctional ligase/repressor BirA n=1 Tax=Entomomonas moraniae TaxID=2213226 RepID=A0A3S9XH75_9GAMM|nr:bifunctional biotin--[acetyl-CoA-carboxylase] ligase/biotin operon repressor BirA [Entomomonas moraniae]AZS51807.1 bifunctional biotin--[acetyl-CoA-carboxylase] ligase/biotin operon repressor BirA [Entomomonas moraniae]
MITLITLLSDGKFHSGEELGKHFKISRAAIWKQLKKLQNDFGLTVDSVRGKGYRLNTPLSLLEIQRLSKEITQWPITVLPSINSTNTECFYLLQLGARPPFAITSEQQTAGKGRRGREWASPFGRNIYYSLMVTLKNGSQQLEGLSLTIGLAVLKTLKKIGINDVGLKWPNDLLVNNKKVCGILIELQGDPADLYNVVIGIGINVNMPSLSLNIDQPWTSLQQELGQLIDRNNLLIELNHSLAHYLDIHTQQGFEYLKNEWEENNVWQNKTVNLLQGNQVTTGVMTGIDKTGALKLLVNNEIQHFNAGEVSLRLAPSSVNNENLS